MSTFLLGQYNAVCDKCGLEFKSSELMKDWQGLMVDVKCYEQRHPQDLIRIKADTSATPWARPEPPDVEVFACYLWGESAYAGLGTAGCMKAGYTPLFYEQLIELKGP